MKSISAVGATVALTLVAACSSVDTEVDWDSGYDFTSLATYDWARQAPQPGVDALFEQRVREIADEVLTSKGFRRALAREADFLVAWQAGVQTNQRYETYGYGIGGWYRGYPGGAWSTTVRHYHEGTLILDVVDRARNELIWRGAASKTLDELGSPDEREVTLREAIKKMMVDFPPQWN